jgi:hypothetical protein
MRAFMLVCWLMLPILIGAYHYGPGQERLRLDEAAALLDKAEHYAASQEWAKAAGAYDEALRLLPPERLADARRIRLERAKAQMLARQLPAAHDDLKALVDDMNGDRSADQQVLTQARSALANSQYYLTWLMRLEGLGKDAWEPEVEAARQQYRLLAEEAESAGDVGAARKHREDLESTIRLARMDLGELQGLPLPSQ